MSVVAVLLGFSMIVAAGFLIAFLWAVRSGQYDDKHTPSIRMLFDDPPPDKPRADPPSQSGKSS
jgi:cbb3-type cytochrome oxidase maturation protein